jgi:GH24 family phage-related lysozyme (muramidase)
MKTPKEHTELLKLREGFVGSVYNDSTNNPTIGYGHKIKKGENFTTLTEEQANELFMQDYLNAQQGADRIIQEFKIPAEDNVRNAVTGAVFQLGEEGFKKFKKTIAFLQQGKFEEAAKEAKNSDWHKQTPVRTSDFENLLLNKQKGGFIDMQEGGLTPDSEGIITLPDTGVIQNEVETPVDTTQGFYSVNPAPGESGESFAARNPLPTLEETFPLGKTDVDADPLSYKPPEDYVSPRITTPLSERLGFGGMGDSSSTNMLAKTGAASVPVDTSLSRDELAALGLLGTIGDVSVGMDAIGDTGTDSIFSTTANPDLSDSFSTFDITEDYLLDPSNVDILSELYPPNKYADNIDFRNRVDGWVLETNKLRGNKTPYTTSQGIAWINLQDKITEISNMDVTSAINAAATVKVVGNKTLANYIQDNPNVITDAGLNETALKKAVSNSLNVVSEEDVKLGGIFDTVGTKESFFTKLGNTQLFEIAGTESVELRDLYDEFGAALLVGLTTGDASKAALAGGIQFAQTDLIEAYGQKAYDLVMSPAGSGNVDEAIAARQKITGWGGAAIAAGGALLLGGSEEDAAFAATQHLAIEFGAERVGELFGLSTGAEGAAAPVGAGVISGLVALLRTGDLKQAAASGITGYAMATNPVLGIGLMALQFLLGKEPSNKTGYASVDFDKFTSQSYSIGDYDSSKMNEDNVEFTKKLLDPIIPLIQKIESDYGFDLKGDLQIHYGARDGLFYTIGDIDQEGLSRRDMFLNRADYFDGKDQNVYRRTFATDEAGLAEFYNSILEDLEYIAKNKVSNLGQYKGIVKSAEEIQADIQKSGFDMSNFTFMQDGGKILDKNTKVLYNSNQAKNYGLVDRKGKAPPSARADDVPMTLKEGDFVLSQPAVALYGEDTINRMVQRAANEAGTNLKSGGKVPVNVHNGEYIIPKKLTEYIGSNVLENMNNRGLMSVGERPNT